MLEAIARHIGKGEFAEIAQAFRHQEGNDRPADEKADGVNEAVIARGHHGCRNTEEGGRGHIVTRNRQAVLEAGDPAACRVKISGRTCARCRPFGDPKGQNDKGAEHGNRRPVGRLFGGLSDITTGGQRHT